MIVPECPKCNSKEKVAEIVTIRKKHPPTNNGDSTIRKVEYVSLNPQTWWCAECNHNFTDEDVSCVNNNA